MVSPRKTWLTRPLQGEPSERARPPATRVNLQGALASPEEGVSADAALVAVRSETSPGSTGFHASAIEVRFADLPFLFQELTLCRAKPTKPISGKYHRIIGLLSQSSAPNPLQSCRLF